MNNIYENNMKFIPFLKFLDKYKSLLIFILIVVIMSVIYFLASNQIQKTKNEKASILYNDWIEEISKEIPNSEKLDNILETLLDSYNKTGYLKLALLSKANLDAKSNNLEEALVNFNQIINLTDGFNGNKVFNKIARVSASRILLSLDNYDEALAMIEKYSLSNTNAYIHELTGDILLKQEKINLAKDQYEIALGKYSDQTSKSIVTMKITNAGSNKSEK
tara:strand:- start:921 stop:1580 length:660 start_codon:yes stop_codon:yes gene_type:complete